jgi:hypothetical protein
MRAKRLALAIAAVGLLALLTACDWFAEYTVINETDQELITWPLLHHCDVLVGQRGDYLDEDVVMPHSTHDYSYISGQFPEPECVQVATKDRRLVLSEPYEYGATYRIREPLQPLSTPIPKESDLPRKPFTETFMDAPQTWSFVLTVWAGMSVGVVTGTLLGTRALYHRFQAKASIIRGGALAAAAIVSAAAWLALVWLWLDTLVTDMPRMS